MTRRLIVCSDGTWQRARSGTPSNVARLAGAILPQTRDGAAQRVFYDEGIGTGGFLDRWFGGLFGFGISTNIRQAYNFLVEHYAEGDELYVFGFSRGAYTVRSLVGLIRKCGLLKKEHAGRFRDAYRIYRKRDKTADTEEAVRFRKDYSRELWSIKFIGVWDTVGALGIPFGPLRLVAWTRSRFHDVALSSRVRYAYQAIAIDERRGAFRPAIWEQSPQAEDQVAAQAWFPGVHLDVGGGYKESGLCDASLLWMKEQAEATGLAFDEAKLKVLAPDALALLHNSLKSFYRIMPRHVRPIGQAKNAHESLHASAQERYDGIDSYRPANLVEYLRPPAATSAAARPGGPARATAPVVRWAGLLALALAAASVLRGRRTPR